MVKQLTKPAGKKAVTTTTGGKPKTSKATAVAKSSVAKKPAVKKLTGKSSKTATELPTKSATSVVKKAATPIAEKKSPVKKTVEKKSKPAAKQKTVVGPTPEERYRMVELAAYFIAEQHGFIGHTDEYWAAAEQQIAASLGI